MPTPAPGVSWKTFRTHADGSNWTLSLTVKTIFKKWERCFKALWIASHSPTVSSWWCHSSTVMLFVIISTSSAGGCSLHAVSLVQRVVEEGLWSARHSGEPCQRMDGGWRGRGCGVSRRWHAGGEAVAEVTTGKWRWRDVRVLLQSWEGVVAVGRAVVQVGGGEACCCGTELGLQH